MLALRMGCTPEQVAQRLTAEEFNELHAVWQEERRSTELTA